MLRKLLLTIGFALLFFIRPLESGAQVPVTIKCENNVKTVTDIRVQITFPSGEMKAYDGKNLESEVLEYHIEGTGECKLFIHFKEEGVKAPTFISNKLPLFILYRCFSSIYPFFYWPIQSASWDGAFHPVSPEYPSCFPAAVAPQSDLL